MQPRLKLPWYRLGQWAGRGAAHRHQVSGLSVVLAMAVACAGVGLLGAGEPVQYSVEGRRSGYTYLEGGDDEHRYFTVLRTTAY